MIPRWFRLLSAGTGAKFPLQGRALTDALGRAMGTNWGLFMVFAGALEMSRPCNRCRRLRHPFHLDD